MSKNKSMRFESHIENTKLPDKPSAPKNLTVAPKLVSITYDSGRGRLTGIDADGRLWVESFVYGTNKVEGWELYSNQFALSVVEK